MVLLVLNLASSLRLMSSLFYHNLFGKCDRINGGVTLRHMKCESRAVNYSFLFLFVFLTSDDRNKASYQIEK